MLRKFLATVLATLFLAAPAWAADQVPLKRNNGIPATFATSDTVGVAHGGTGATTLTAHCVIIGLGTSAVHFACPSSAGQVLGDNGASSDPTFQAVTVPCGGLPALTGDVTTSAGSCATAIGANKVTTSTINNSAVTLAKVANIAADTVLSNFTGSSAAPAANAINDCHGASNALTYNTSTHALGCNTISGSGTVTTTGSPASGNLAKFSGATSIVNGDLSGDVTTSGTLATTIASNAVTTGKINNSAVTLAKIANAAANTVFVGAGSAGSGSAYAEQTIAAGTGISITPGASGITITNAGSPGTGAEILISEVVTSSSQASVTFSSIPATYRDLIVRARGRTSPAATAVNIVAQFNGDTAGNYDTQTVQGASSSPTANGAFGQTTATVIQLTGSSATANWPGAGDMVIYNYRDTTFTKVGTGISNQLGGSTTVVFGIQWRSTAAITSIKLAPTSGTIVDNSVFSLYGRY